MTGVRLSWVAALAAALGACGPAAAPSVPPLEPAPPAPAPTAAAPAPAPLAAASAQGPRRPTAASFTFDGFALGAPYASAVMARAPYDAPCDDDPIDERARRFMVYGGLPCRGRAFPEETTVLFYLRFAAGDARLEQPIEAFAWLGGGYFSTRSTFPLRVGEPASRAEEVLGPAVRTFRLERKEHTLTVQTHAGDVHALVVGATLAGFVVGPMPEDPANEQWRGLMQMAARYTRLPVAR